MSTLLSGESNLAITGAHVVLYSTKSDADRAFFRDVLKFPYIDVGEGWLIFELPPAEVAFRQHTSNEDLDIDKQCYFSRAETLCQSIRSMKLPRKYFLGLF